MRVGRSRTCFHPEIALFGCKAEDLIIRVSDTLRIKRKKGLYDRLAAHQIDELGENNFNPIGGFGEKLREHFVRHRSSFISRRDLLKSCKCGLNRITAIGEITDGLSTDQHKIHLVALALQFSETLLSALDDGGVVATAEATPVSQ